MAANPLNKTPSFIKNPRREAVASVDEATIGLVDLVRFKRWLEVTPYRVGRARSGSTVNAILTAVCEFLRFAARTGAIEPAVADRLSEPRYLWFTPPGFDTGEQGQFRTVRARALKARAETPFPDALTGEQASGAAPLKAGGYIRCRSCWACPGITD